MTAKEYLNRARRMNAVIDTKLDEIARLRMWATRLSPTALFDKNGGVSDRVGRTAAKIVDLERKIDAEIDEVAELRDEIMQTIGKVEDVNARMLLEMRYINGWSWRKIANKMNYSEKHLTGYLHRKALIEIEKLIPHNT